MGLYCIYRLDERETLDVFMVGCCRVVMNIVGKLSAHVGMFLALPFLYSVCFWWNISEVDIK